MNKPIRYSIIGGVAAIGLSLIAARTPDDNGGGSRWDDTATTTIEGAVEGAISDECVELLAYGVEMAPVIDDMSNFGTDPELTDILDRMADGDMTTMIDGPPVFHTMADDLRNVSEAMENPPAMLEAPFSLARDGTDLVADGLDQVADGMAAYDIDEMTDGMDDITEGGELVEEATALLEGATADCTE